MAYARKYDITERSVKIDTRPIVIWWRIFSGPRRSNFPKSLDPGMIESPVPLDCIVMTMMRSTAIMMRRVFISEKVNSIGKMEKSAVLYKGIVFLQILVFFAFCEVLR